MAVFVRPFTFSLLEEKGCQVRVYDNNPQNLKFRKSILGKAEPKQNKKAIVLTG